MADPVKRAEILPGDATPREKAYAAVDARFEDIDTDLVRRVKSVAEAPAAYLPYLAWERSVDVYDPAWPEDVRRAVIAAAPEVHRYKGTRHAVQTALGALGITAEIVEWWQTSPRAAPYTFHVRAYARTPLYDGPLLDQRLIRTVYAAINRAKPLSRAYTLAVAAVLPTRLGVAPILATRARVGAAMHPRNEEAFAARIGLAPVVVTRTRVSALMIASP